MARWADIVTAVKTTVSTNTSDADARAWVLSAARKLNADAQFLTTESTITTTVAGQAEYALDSQLVDLIALRIGNTIYDRVSANDIWQLEDSTNPAYLQGGGGAFAPAFTSTGLPKIVIYPTPSVAGDAIEGRQVIRIPSPADWAAEDPALPEVFDEAIVDGASAIGLKRRNEYGEADTHEQRFLAAVPELRRFRNSRIGSGPVRFRLANR